MRPLLYCTRWILLGASLLSLTACTDLMVLTGARVRLSDTPIQSIQAHLVQGPAMYPGQRANLVISVIQPDGKILLTEGAGQGPVLWEDLHIESNLSAVDERGNIMLPPDPLETLGKVPSVTISVPSHPGMSTTLNIPLRYNAQYVADFSGTPGARGLPGRDGADGRGGRDGSSDRAHPSSGGDGGDGQDGGPGGPGGPGENALPVLVQLVL